MHHLTIIFAACSTLALGACKQSADTASPDATGDTKSASAADGLDDPSKDPSKGKVRIGAKLAELCGIADPAFDFDSASLGSAAKSTLDALAQCLVDGPAKDQQIQLVGHADPRGDEEYNLGLGQRRATTVVDYLVKKGRVPEDRMESSSRGELDARGTDEASWAEDRRVDITLVE